MVEYKYDIMDRVTNISWKTASGATLGGFGYEYAAVGRIASTLSLSTRSTRSTRLNIRLYLYDNLNERVATVSDRNFNSIIDWTGPDLISSNGTRYVKLGGDWWRETRQWSIHDDNSTEARLMGVRRSRVTGLGANGLASEAISIDQRGNATTNRVFRNRASAEEIAWVKYPTSTTPAVTVSSNGLVYSSTLQTGVTTTFAYDAFQREVSQTDGRGNTTHTVYDNLGRVASTIDALGYATAYGYDALGRQTSVTDPLTNTVTTAYDAEGHVVSQRGATYPVDYAYDEFGDKVSMTTYRNAGGPGFVLAAGDTTRWLRDEATGLVTNKVYADGKGPRYDYTPDGKLATRTWARGIVTTYSYDDNGSLTNTVYSDGTPTISLAYNRAGRQIEAHDAAGDVTRWLRDPYLGLDRTDEGRKSHTVTNASVAVSPVFSGTTNVLWTACGICEFVGPTNQTSVQYRNKDFETASESVGKERLAASVKLAGMDSSVVCSTNFTVVKVDVKIGDVGEDKEESEGAVIMYVRNADDGTLTQEGTDSLVKVLLMCQPNDPMLHDNVTVIVPEGSLYAQHGGKYYKVGHEQIIPVSLFTGLDFYLHGHSVSTLKSDKLIKLMHNNSGAMDFAVFTVCGVEMITPSGDPVYAPIDSGDGQNEFTYNSADIGVLTMSLKAKVFSIFGNDNLKGKFSVDAIGDSIMAWDAANPDGEATLDGNIFSAKVTFTGLPKRNSDFGTKVASVTCDGVGRDSNDYEVFFPANESNHPTCTVVDHIDCDSCPNWFYYWKEGNVCGIPPDALYKEFANPLIIGKFDKFTGKIYIGRRAPNYRNKIDVYSNAVQVVSMPGIPLYDIEGNEVMTEEVLLTNIVRVAFKIGAEGAGVRAVAATVKHELRHAEIWSNYPLFGSSPEEILGYGIELPGELESRVEGDSDMDEVMDLDEISGRWGIETNPEVQDTFNLSGLIDISYESYGDNEVRARIAESEELCYDEGNDWANPGCQSKIVRGPMKDESTIR